MVSPWEAQNQTMPKAQPCPTARRAPSRLPRVLHSGVFLLRSYPFASTTGELGALDPRCPHDHPELAAPDPQLISARRARSPAPARENVQQHLGGEGFGSLIPASCGSQAARGSAASSQQLGCSCRAADPTPCSQQEPATAAPVPGKAAPREEPGQLLQQR